MKGNVIPFHENWTFLRTELSATMGELERQKTRFVPVELPHDWLIYDAKNLYRNGCGWYRKEFELVTGEIEDLGADLAQAVHAGAGGSVQAAQTGAGTPAQAVHAGAGGSVQAAHTGAGAPARPQREPERIVARTHRGERVILRFDGVYMDSTVYVNGKKIGDWKYGYSTFDMDVTSALMPGKNQVTVEVRYQSPNSRWYSGAGMYRKVWLKVCPAAYLPLDGTYVTTEKCEGGFLLTAQTEVAGKLDTDVGCRYRLWKDGQPVRDLGWQPVEAGGKVTVQALIPDPALWDVEDPQCYELTVELCRRGRESYVIDSQEITLGFRTIEFTTDRGLFLNGRHVKVHGVCEHHDFGCLGAAFHTPAMVRKIRMLQKMGVNAIRTSHNMPAPELMELADRMGILILSEAFDMWERPKTEFDYGRFFKDWCERDVRSWIRRDRNHPCLLLWSIGNEIYDTHADEHGQEITRRLVRAVREHDPGENAPITIGSNYMAWENARKCADIVKVAGYNYGENLYEEQHREHPDWVMYGSETASVVQSRGIYHFPLKQPVLSDEDEQCSSLGNSSTSWGAKSWERCIADDRDPEYIWGQFIWTGFDYIGEPTPYHTKNSYFGQVDTAGFPKDSYYVFQAEWTDVRKAPMVHLFPYWDFNPGQLIDVRACTNAPEVELFVNGRSQGRQAIDHAHGRKLLGEWQVPYEPGTITAVAYDGNGQELCRDSHSSFGDSKKLVLSADRTELAADCEDMCFVTVSALDEQGNPVENAADYVKAELTGPGRILGMDNGDSTDDDDYKTTVRKLFSGKLLVVVGSTGEAGDIVLTVSGRGLESAELRIRAAEPGETALAVALREKNVVGMPAAGEKNPAGEETGEENPAGGGTGEGNPAGEKAGDGNGKEGTSGRKLAYLEDCRRLRKADFPKRIPIRKLEIRSLDGQRFDPNKREILVEARLFPEDTTDRELVWKAVTAAGIEANHAKVVPVEEPGKYLARVTALGDGEIYVRCLAGNHKKTVLISHLECRAEGLGLANVNPYEFVSAGLYTEAVGEIGNGNEKGIATARGGESGVVFSGVDFGSYGSDEVTLPIFALDGEPHAIDVWLGKPYEAGSRLLQSLTYQKPSVWNVYQEETYRLPERIRGVATIAFLLHDKVHLKGFCFRKLEKAYGRLSGGEADAVYGDSFRLDGGVLRDIGNNVTVVYDDMDFGESGADTVVVSGRTPLDGNTMHIRFTEEQGETTDRIVEFRGTGSEECTSQTFPVSGLRGRGKVELVFLPGSRFDLESVQFGRGGHAGTKE